MNERKYETYRKERELGMTYEEIARKHGVTKQYIHQVVAAGGGKGMRVVREKDCIYPAWRRWMNEHMMTKSALLRQMGMYPAGENIRKLSGYMVGRGTVRKDYIDKLLQVTGMRYEDLFRLEA